MLDIESLRLIEETAKSMEKGFEKLPDYSPSIELNEIKKVLEEVAIKMQNNFPYPHPLYAGQMLKPPHSIARLAYILSLWINPNNHALDGGRASSTMEKEAVLEIAKMFGLKTSLAHLCGGGTMANLEALWIASQTTEKPMIVASEQAHYTHSRLCHILKIPFKSIATDDLGRMDMSQLESTLKNDNIGTVVATLGTTAIGSIDPLKSILDLKSKYNFRVHVDAAYGGYFKLAKNLDNNAIESFNFIHEADSIVVDPHKHGLQPYGCGCVLFKDPTVGKFYKHDSPYTYFSSDELHLGEISLECSRPGSAAVALWATQKLFPLVPKGKFATSLENCHSAALELHKRISKDPRFITAFPPELDIVVYAVKAKTASQVSKLSRQIFDIAANKGLHLAIANLPSKFFKSNSTDIDWDQEYITCLRSCLMKPEHLTWLENIWQILDEAVTDITHKS